MGDLRNTLCAARRLDRGANLAHFRFTFQIAVLDILAEGHAVVNGLLKQNRHQAPEVTRLNLLKIDAVDLDLPALRIIKYAEQLYQSALARAVRTYNRHH